MNTPALHVQRLTATVHTGHDGDGRRVDRMLHRLADRRLDDALRAVTLPAGRWCVRRIDIPIHLGPDDTDSTVETAWARRLIAVLQHALAQQSPDVVHYHHDHDALTDLLTRVAAGRHDRAWAWTGLGLLPAGQPAPGQPAAAVILTALSRRPEHALAAVANAVRRTGTAPLDRALGADGWTAVAALVSAAATGTPQQPAPPATPPPPATVAAAPVNPAPPATATVHTLAAALVRTSELAAALRSSRLRPPAATRTAWAVLVIAGTDPVLLSRPGARAAAVIDAVAELLAPATTTPPTPPPPPPTAAAPAYRGVTETVPTPPGAGERPPSAAPPGRTRNTAPLPTPPEATPTRATTAAPPRSRTPDETAADDTAEPDHRYTIWAGLPFLLATAADAGIPAVIADDPVLAARPLRWTLHAIARTLIPADADDPAVLALAGLGPTADPPSGDAEPAEQARVDELARTWAAATTARFPQPGNTDIVSRVARRTGHVVADPGWIDIHLRLDEVDVDVRRAGLDLDPGWVPWLATVVRFRYA